MKIEDHRKDGHISVSRIWHGSCFEFDGHFYMRVRLDSTYASVRVPANHVAAINLKGGSIRALHGNTSVRAIVVVATVVGTGTLGFDFGDVPLKESRAGSGRDEDEP